ncbi:uncharacterized protein sb:cb1058 [Megalops cyprinoides]|uniref:uncharacterized protein sb:cb1058 n=1 Tax=Megalops cyprinoides TaxID=118141 RepID=UPI0018650EBE|nr:uncharacterized protein sb:cb1058 [Megalops cyprinoides]
MAIGKTSKKSVKGQKFLDRASGFYGHLDEPEVLPEWVGERGMREAGMEGGGREHARMKGAEGKQEPGVFDFNQGMLEDDGTAMLLRTRLSWRSSRWRRRSSRRLLEEGAKPEPPAQELEEEPPPQAIEVSPPHMDAGRLAERSVVHFFIREEADDQILISGKAEREMEGQPGEEEMKVAKRRTLKNYRKTLDRALRRGWQAFITNLHSVTLTPVASTSSSSPAKVCHGSAIIEYQ